MIAHNLDQETVTLITERGSALVARVIREYEEGASRWSLSNRYAQYMSRSEVHRLLTGKVRGPKPPEKTEEIRSSKSRRRGKDNDPSEEEIVALRDATKAQWSAEVASRRWVGRYLSRNETAGEALSKALRKTGGDY